MEFIHYSEVLHLMDKLDDDHKPIPFSVTFPTETGRFIEIKRAVKNVLDKDDPSLNAIRHGKAVIKPDYYRAAKRMWVDIKDMDTQQIIRVYPRTIMVFNGYKVSFDI